MLNSATLKLETLSLCNFKLIFKPFEQLFVGWFFAIH